jgi:hypothetical protein
VQQMMHLSSGLGGNERGVDFGASARIRQSSRKGSILVGPVGNEVNPREGGCRLWERGTFQSGGASSPVCVKGAGLAGETEYRAQWAR